MPTRARASRRSAPVRPANKMLAALPEADFARLQPHLRTIPLTRKHVFYSAGDRIQHAVFPNGGMASITAAMQDGTMVETATVGNEGFVGLELCFGGDIATGETMIQVPGTDAEILPASVFRAELERRAGLFEAAQRYSHAVMTLIMQSTACMAFHAVQERCCRWLLMTHDRVERDEFVLSQEFLAMMLGATRPTVNVVASTLQKAGYIRYSHGRITILDRPGLEASACECYATVRAQFDRLGW